MSNFVTSFRYVKENVSNFRNYFSSSLTHKSPGLKPDWFEEINLFSITTHVGHYTLGY